MKLFLVLVMFVSTQAHSSEVCRFKETVNFTEAVENGLGKKIHVSKDHSRFTTLEKKMIFQAVALQEWLEIKTQQDALNSFGDFNDGAMEPGNMAGSVDYYEVKGQTIVLVTYFPGDNEYGSIFELKASGAAKMVASVEDSFISCDK